jgi:hypothetical protein
MIEVRVACDQCLKAKNIDEMTTEPDEGPWFCNDCADTEEE